MLIEARVATYPDELSRAIGAVALIHLEHAGCANSVSIEDFSAPAREECERLLAMPFPAPLEQDPPPKRPNAKGVPLLDRRTGVTLLVGMSGRQLLGRYEVDTHTLQRVRTVCDRHRVGGSGDEGIDGIGLAPISPVLASRVAVQAKRYEPGKVHGRDVVALFQRDAGAAGAERAVLVTLARFSPAAEKAATVATPTVNLIDGQKLCDLIEEQGVGLQQVTQVVASFFDRFDKVADPGVRGL